MEKRGVIEPGRTPPEVPRDDQQKQSAEQDLEQHPTKRLADAARESVGEPPPPE